MKRNAANVLSVLVVATLAVEGATLVKPRNLAKANQGVCAVALAPDGLPHAAYQGADYHLYHAWLTGTKWQHEPIDNTSDCGWGNSIAVDAAGVVHATYGAFRGLGAQKLVYARRDADGWQITDLGVDGEQTRLCLDAAGNPHVLFISGMTYAYARSDAKGWQIEDTGLPWSWCSAGLAVDGAGAAHISYAVNYGGCFYATNASGDWQVTPLVDGTVAHTSLALDPNGRPCVAVALPQTLRCFQFDGTVWQQTDLLDATMLPGFVLDGVALALGPGGRPRALLAGSVGGALEIALYAYDNGLAPAGILVDTKNAGFYPSLALGPDGVGHGTYCAGAQGRSTARYVRLALPDLTGAWAAAGLDAGTGTFTGTLRVRNPGPVKSPATGVSFFVSEDPLLDAGDVPLGPVLKLKSLKPGGTLDLPVRLTDARLTPGRHLIAVIDPTMVTGDPNAMDNVVPVQLP